MKYLILVMIGLNLTACGSSPVTTQASYTLPDSACEMRDSCTYVDVPGYQCQALRWNPDFGEGAHRSPDFYGNSPCVITKEDWQFTPGCDPANPNQMCGGGWGGTPYPCCQMMQGPGPASILN